MSAFEAATAVTPDGEDGYRWSVPDGWQQGRGAWGGLVVAALLNAVIATEPAPQRTVRSVALQIMAPAVVGTHSIQVHCLRSGSAMSTWRASLRDEGHGEVAALTAILGTPRIADARLDHTAWGMASMPPVSPPEHVPVIPVGPPMGPVFGQHLRFQLVRGLPMSGDPAETLGWISFAEPTAVTAVSLLAMVDAWWPACFVIVPDLQRLATVTFAANLLVDPQTVMAGQPMLHHSFLTAAHQGFTSEHRRLWTVDGRLAVDNVQSIVVGA